MPLSPDQVSENFKNCGLTDEQVCQLIDEALVANALSSTGFPIKVAKNVLVGKARNQYNNKAYSGGNIEAVISKYYGAYSGWKVTISHANDGNVVWQFDQILADRPTWGF